MTTRQETPKQSPQPAQHNSSPHSLFFRLQAPSAITHTEMLKSSNTDSVSGNSYTSDLATESEHDSSPTIYTPSFTTNPLQEASQQFLTLIPSLKRITRRDYGSLLVGVLSECHEHMSLEEFFNLIFNDQSPEDINPSNTDNLKSKNANSFELKVRALKLCHLVLQSFAKPETFMDGILQYSMITTVNFHEVSRNFLAIKIVMGCLKKDEGPSVTLARSCIYKLYFIICHRLIQKFPQTARALNLHQGLVLSQSKLGIVIKMVYPDLVCKRLGRRGESKTHYIGLTCNYEVLDDEILELLKLDLLELKDNFDSTTNIIAELPEMHVKETIYDSTESQDLGHTACSSPTPTTNQPLYSFVDLRNTYPDTDCSPRSWTITPNCVPKQSEWSMGVIGRSADILRSQGVDVGPLIVNFIAGNFCEDDHHSLPRVVTQAMKVLLYASASRETFLHLYLVVILLVLPVATSSVQEVSNFSKSLLRSSLNKCVAQLECEIYTFASVDKLSLSSFTRVLRKVIHLNELAMTSIDMNYSDSILTEMTRDLMASANKDNSSDEFSVIEDVTIQGAIMAFNAYNFELAVDNPASCDLKSAQNVIDIAKIFHRAMSTLAETTAQGGFSSDIENMAIKRDLDIPQQVFRLSTKIFHHFTLSFSEISQLPIPILNFIFLHVLNETQKANFAEFAKRAPNVSKETFKAWWIFASMFQEYMCVMSEALSLSQTLA